MPAGSPPPLRSWQPAPLARLHRDANKIMNVGQSGYERTLAGLKGYPVVVNQWASWCENCRFEFPFFQRLSERYASRVAFVGLDSQDEASGAGDFLEEFPVNYPSVFDPSASIARSVGGGTAWPTTVNGIQGRRG